MDRPCFLIDYLRYKYQDQGNAGGSRFTEISTPIDLCQAGVEHARKFLPEPADPVVLFVHYEDISTAVGLTPPCELHNLIVDINLKPSEWFIAQYKTNIIYVVYSVGA